MHIRRKYRMRNSIEVCEFNSAKVPGVNRIRRPKEKPTCERIKKNNQRRKQREAARMVEQHFNEDDLVLTLTFRIKDRPVDMEAAKQTFKDFANYMRKEYRKRYYELFWMRNIERGPKNAWHIHVIVNRIEGAEFMIKDYWRKFGGVYFQYLQDKRDEGEDIGEYIAKSPITCDRVAETSWSHSRNIKKVEGEDTIISGHAMTDKPRVPKGWYLDKESCYEGTNADGYPYRTYTIRRLKKQRIDHRMPVRKIRAIKDSRRRRKTSGRTDKADNRLARN